MEDSALTEEPALLDVHPQTQAVSFAAEGPRVNLQVELDRVSGNLQHDVAVRNRGVTAE